MDDSETPTKKSVSDDKDKKKKSFLTVGIGASAGGVQALKEFFAKMPPDSGIAFAVVLHLSQIHQSNLAEILGRETKMPVIQVSEAVKVEPNHVYVIPPAKAMEMVDGIVRVTQPQRPRGTRVVIDRFFRTLADAYGESAVGIVLSGTSEDGTLGIKRIKEYNGFAIVQKPTDAEYEQMPRSAIETGMVDWVLAVEEMPEKLLSLRNSTEELRLTEADDKVIAPELNDRNAFSEILAVLRVRTGHDFSSYKHPTLLRRIARHLQIHELENMAEYAKLLRKQPEEAEFLLSNLLINVTNFFRDTEAFEVLETDVVPRLFAGKTANDQIRVWVPACATGEEAYSIAMLLYEYAARFEDVPKIQIFASDVDDEAITFAREGLYIETICSQDVSPARLRNFFKKEGKAYRVKKSLREMILFTPHNVLRDPPFSTLDLISCRNLLIYLNREAQEKLVNLFHFALQPNGFLFLGSSEVAEHLPLLFAPYDKQRRIYLRRPSNPMIQPALPLHDLRRYDKTAATQVSIEEPGRAVSINELHFRLLEKYAPPSLLVNEDYEIVHLTENVGRYLQFGGGEPSSNLLKVVNPALRADLLAALFTARQERKMAETRPLSAEIAGKNRFVNVRVQPVETHNESGVFMLVIFEESESAENAAPADSTLASLKFDGANQTMEIIVRRLEEELSRTKNRLRSTIEQHETSIEELKASNEELQSMNEELRSATEELETSKEELQSVNEELTTVNAELKEIIEEVSNANADWQNLMHSTNIGVIFLNRNLQIKRFTPATQEIFNLIPSDIGRPLEHLTHNLDYKNLTEEAKQVLSNLGIIEREVKSEKGRHFIARLLPYRTLDDKIDGVVLTFVDITERKQAEEAEFFLASIVESSRDSMITINFDGKITSWNKAAEELYGYPAAEAIGKPLTMLTLPEDLQEILGNIEKIKNSETVLIFDTVRVHKGGREMNLEIVLSPVKDRAGKVIGVSTVARDVTERRKAEEASRESEESFRMMVDSVPESIWITDAEGRVEFLNKHWYEYCGVTEGQATAAEIAAEFLHPDDGQKVMQAFTEALRTGKEFEVEQRNRSATGEYRWFLNRAQPYQDPKTGEITKWVGVGVDIHDRKQIEEALRFQGHLLNTVEQSVIATDLEGKVTYWNRFAEELYGWTTEEAVGRNIMDLTPSETDLKRAEEIMSRLRRGETWAGEFNVRRRDGSTFLAQVFNTPITDDKGNLIGIVGVSTDITARKKTEAALRHNEEMFSALVNNAPFGVYLIDSEFRLRSVNHGAQAVFTGIEPLIGRDFAEILRLVWEEPFATEAIERFRHTLRTGESYYSPTIVEHRGNIDKIESYDWQLHRISLPDETYGVVCYFYDLTEQRQMQNALRESEERFRAIVTQVTAGIAEVDLTGKFNFVNDRYAEIVGYSRAELLGGMRMQDITHPDDLKTNYPLFEKCITEGKSFVIEKRYIRKDGTEIWVNNSVSPELDEQGKTRFITSVTIDIAERKKTEDALKHSEERLRLLVESIEDYAILTMTPDNRINSWNTGAERIFGYSEEEALGLPGEILFTPEDRAKNEHENEIKTAIETGRAADERWHLRKDGSRFFASGVLTILGETAENGFVKILRDLTERKQFEDALKEGDRRKDEFLATLAHELRNPLAPIRTALEIMRRDSDKEKGQHAREIIERQTNQLVHLVDDLLDISRITQDKIKLRKERVDIADSISAAVETVQPFVENSRHRLDVRLPDAPVFVEADPTRLSQVVLNLLHNSAKYTEPGGHILLIAAREGDEALIRVRDNGIGIQFEMLPAIFDIFAQTATGEKRGQGGLGIGLSLVKKLVEMHGGRVEAHSEGEGKGSEFIVRLPLAANQKPEKKQEKQELEKTRTPIKSGRILVVDDNTDAAHMLEIFLSMDNHKVQTAFTGNEALNLAAEFQPDTVILDIGLPDIDGYEVAKRLRERSPDICLIALSGWGQDEDRRRSNEAGFNHHLVKPVNIEELKKFLCL